ATRLPRTGDQPDRVLLASLRTDLKALEDRLDARAPDLPPGDYIESRRLLTRLKVTLRGLAGGRRCKAGTGRWYTGVKTVADLVDYCVKNGLEFGPAAPGDEASYTATCDALRRYERQLVSAASP